MRILLSILFVINANAGEVAAVLNPTNELVFKIESQIPGIVGEFELKPSFSCATVIPEGAGESYSSVNTFNLNYESNIKMTGETKDHRQSFFDGTFKNLELAEVKAPQSRSLTNRSSCDLSMSLSFWYRGIDFNDKIQILENLLGNIRSTRGTKNFTNDLVKNLDGAKFLLKREPWGTCFDSDLQKQAPCCYIALYKLQSNDGQKSTEKLIGRAINYTSTKSCY